MGNQVVKEYDVRAQIATGGPGGVWKVYEAVKKTNARPVAVFIFERKTLEQAFAGKKTLSKRAQEVVFEALKREALQLTRLRHPCVLEVVEPLTESRGVLAFATEPVFASLSNLLGNYTNLSPVPQELTNFQLCDLEIQKGALQIARGLQFLHDDAKLIHGNLNPEAIFVNSKGDWKISGFSFCCATRYETGNQKAFMYQHFDPQLPLFAQPYLDYLAPEYIFENRCDISSDMFSLGCLAYALFNGGKSPLLAGRDSAAAYKEAIAKLDQIDYSPIPQTFRASLQQMLNTHAEARPVARQVPTSPFFDDMLLKALLFLDVMVQKTPAEKAEFFRSLPKVMPQFPDRVLLRKILPTLLDELKDLQLAPFLLLSILFVCEKLSPEDYTTKVLPSLRPLFTVADPPQISIILIQKVDLLLKKTPKSDIKDHVMPLLYHALETPNPQIQQKALKALPQVMETLDYGTIKNFVYPRLENLLRTSEVPSVRVTTLLCVHSILKVLDKSLLLERVIPALKIARKPDAAVLMATLGVLDEMAKKYLDKESIAIEILPQLWRMMMEPVLNVQQFKTFVGVVRELSRIVEEQQLQQLEQQAALESQAKALNLGAASIVENDLTSFNQIVSSVAPATGTLANVAAAPSLVPAKAPIGNTSMSPASSNSISGWLDEHLGTTEPTPAVAVPQLPTRSSVPPKQATQPMPLPQPSNPQQLVASLQATSTVPVSQIVTAPLPAKTTTATTAVLTQPGLPMPTQPVQPTLPASASQIVQPAQLTKPIQSAQPIQPSPSSQPMQTAMLMQPLQPLQPIAMTQSAPPMQLMQPMPIQPITTAVPAQPMLPQAMPSQQVKFSTTGFDHFTSMSPSAAPLVPSQPAASSFSGWDALSRPMAATVPTQPITGGAFDFFNSTNGFASAPQSYNSGGTMGGFTDFGALSQSSGSATTAPSATTAMAKVNKSVISEFDSLI